MPLDLPLAADLTAFRDRAREFLAAEIAPERVAGHGDPTDLTGFDETFERAHHRAAGAAGFLGVAAPERWGGGGRPGSWASIYMHEAAYADAPSIDTAWMLCGPVVAAFGSDAQRDRWLPRMVAGEMTGCIAYTEPHAGTDLGASSMVAEADGSGWRLTGRKVLVTGGHKADLCITTALTDPAAGARRGMTMFAIELPAEGVRGIRWPTVNRWTLSELEFDAAPVGPDAVLGTVGSGWAQLTGAVAAERSGMAWLGWSARVLEALEAWLRDRGSIDRSEREAVARLRVDLDAGARLALRVLAAQDAGQPGIVEGAAAKVYCTELMARLARVGSDLVGLTALEWGPLAAPIPGVPLGGRLGYEVLERIHPTISVGANEVQRDMLARLALDLPRAT